MHIMHTINKVTIKKRKWDNMKNLLKNRHGFFRSTFLPLCNTITKPHKP